ncbi:peptidase family M1-domain-containing protein [Fusarium flagelliforme]|uniref:Aminopeptidase n=1 Tax=Fusarium flagelliforme TaxID=2675880 RepID=A0A395MTE3_9HYPO|nr:peptidase family M1-domain-containing protein [Fusarium flagelliforme]KAH7185905.1 peptidase family M1-domain-containing protein [Fusarium flagelliforme]RFN51218.1 aminopeptidase [Fusarium flagelliforme]
MPSAEVETLPSHIVGGNAQSRPRLEQPLTYTGSLDNYSQFDVTPVIGREFNGLQIRDLLKWDDIHIRDLAVTISQRGVVFLKDQDVTPNEMKDFMLRLTDLAGCPSTSGLHVHPLTEEGSELGDQISVISSEKQKKGGGLTHQLSDVSRFASAGWHSDITFEKVPSDYAMLKIHTLPATGGDTLWASGYEVYDRLSDPMKKFLEGLTATHDASFFHDEARRLGNPIRKGIRGSPLNQGEDLTAVHPLIRTNPVTGWKSVFVNKGFTKRINGLSRDESDTLLAYLFNLVTQNHDAQVRYRWSKNDCAIWDNRSTFHCATYDYIEARAGDRVASLGEAPYLDTNIGGRNPMTRTFHSHSRPLPRISLGASSLSASRSSITTTTTTTSSRPHHTSQLPYLKSSSTTPSLRSIPRPSIRDSKVTSLISRQQRNCSCRRAMLRNGEDVTSASLDVRRGRQVLPKNVKPLHYDLTLEPNFETFKYEGTVVIDFDVVEDSTSIALNTVDLEIHETLVEANGATISSSPTLDYDKDSQTTTITFDKTIPAGQKARLTQRFTGILNDDMAGFYRSSYKDEQGNTKYIATTQFEATDARRAFPCLDEPALKATFTVTLIADKDLVCLGNMDVASEKEVDSKVTGKKSKAITYNKTPIMSTYLLAFIIGDLKHYETNNFRVPIRVWCTPDQDLDHAVFSAELGARTLEFYEKNFGSQYPLPKMDMVAIPDFAAGAMENWGLITYRVVDLLLDEKTSSAVTKKRVAEVVQHELAHQWFGNLVTMDFWDGLWLKEGFATWMSWYSSNAFYPEWRIWEGYVTEDLRSALGLDSLRSSHPIEVPVKRADEVNQIFDAISYEKGSCVLRMISKYLGEDVFLKGIRIYLDRHAYGNTETTDLWAALSEASGKDVERVADIWTKKVGYPVVAVTEDESKGTIHVKQNRFLRTADVKPEEDEVLYPVFLNLRTKEGIQEDLALNVREADFKVPDFDFYKVNSGHSGIYRTSYTSERLQRLGQNAKAGLLGVEDRAGMIADAGALAAAGYQKTSGLLSLLQGFDSEDEFIVWDEITLRVASLRDAWIFEEDDVNKALKAFQRDLVSKKANEIGWNISSSDDFTAQRFKALMFGKAAIVEDESAKKAAFELFEKFINGDREAVQPNLRSSVFGVVLTYGGEAEYNAVLKEYETAKQSSERNTALRSLGFAKDPELIKRTLAYTLSDNVKTQDIYMPLAGLRAHKEGVLALWGWVKENWDVLTKRLPPGMSLLGDMVAISTSSFTHADQIDDVKSFFEEKGNKGFELELAQSLDAMKAKQNWLARDKEDVKQWLAQNKYL